MESCELQLQQRCYLIAKNKARETQSEKITNYKIVAGVPNETSQVGFCFCFLFFIFHLRLHKTFIR